MSEVERIEDELRRCFGGEACHGLAKVVGKAVQRLPQEAPTKKEVP